MIYDSYEVSGDAALRVLAQEDRIPAIREMTDGGRAITAVGRTHVRAAARRSSPAPLASAAVALIAATDILVWKLLRREMGLAAQDRRTNRHRDGHRAGRGAS